jgi:murein DD-endopeptidase MepM/ murein hydrolase activator NlpD
LGTVQWTGGSLNLPDATVLKNLTIVVENGDVNLNGDRHLLENVRLIVLNGSVNLGDVRAVNTSVYSAGGIRMNQGARFAGKNFLGTQNGDVIFNGATETIGGNDYVKVVAHGDLIFNAAANTRGDFWSTEDFFANRDSSIVGKIRAQQSITFNAHVNVIGAAIGAIDLSTKNQPLIGILDTGISRNPDIDSTRITTLRDWVDGDNDPFLAAGQGSEHGTHVTGIIGAISGNNLGIDGVNQNAPLAIGRVTGSGQWANALVEYVDRFRASGQPNGVVYLGFDLTQLNADGSITTRYELTLAERSALEYARQRGVLVVVPAGNDGDVMSVLGQAAQEFDNIITIGSADGQTRANYSSYGQGLGLLAPGGTIDNPILSTVGNGLGSMAGTSISAAYATGQIANVWAANPQLSYRQVIEIIKATATDLGDEGWDEQTGAGLLDTETAIEMARSVTPEKYETPSIVLPEKWSGEGLVVPLERPANWSTDFTGTIMSTVGANVRKEPSISSPVIGTRAFNPNEKIKFTHWTYGDRITDIELGTPDERWYYDAVRGGWIASAIVRGNAPGSSPLRPISSPQDPIKDPKVQPVNPNPARPGEQREYIVRPGDTLSAIAQRELGNANRWQEIQKANGNRFTEIDARNLQVGQHIYLPIFYTKGSGKSGKSNANFVDVKNDFTKTVVHSISLTSSISINDVGDDDFNEIVYPREFVGEIPSGAIREGQFDYLEFQPTKQSSTLPLALIQIGAVTTQADSPIPGPADVAGAIIILGGLFLLAASAILEQNAISPPGKLAAFPNATYAKPKTPVQNGGGLRKRWKDGKTKEIFEWDYQHGTVEKYNSRGKHLGEFDPTTGKQLKPADTKRTIQP